jgi:hypothetical protein
MGTRIYLVYGWGSLRFSRYRSTSGLKRIDLTIPYGHDQHIIKCSLTQGTRIHMVYWWWSQWFSKYLSTSDFKGTGLLCRITTYIPSDANWHKKQEYMVWGWGSQWCLRYWHTSCLRGCVTAMCGHNLHTIRCYTVLDKRNKNIYGLGVSISTSLEIFGHFLFTGGWDHLVLSWPTCHLMLLDTRNKNIYILGVENSTLL